MERDKSILISCPDIGGGNPASSIAVYNLLESQGAQVDHMLLTAVARPPQELAKLLIRYPIFTHEYTSHSEQYRTGAAMYAFGLCALAEMVARRPQLILSEHNPYGIIIGVQEHQFAAYPKRLLERNFPYGRYLLIPDVEPKKSGIEIMKKKGIKPLVWNRQAYDHLLTDGLEPVLIQSFLPQGFLETNESIGSREDYIVIRSAGSGIPTVYKERLIESLNRLGYHYKFYLPDQVITETGIVNLSGSKGDKYRQFYREIIEKPPRLLIGFPGEMIQVAASLGCPILSLPPKGAHEVVSMNWAIGKGVCQGKIEFSESTNLDSAIRTAYEAQLTPDCVNNLGLGTTSIFDAIF